MTENSARLARTRQGTRAGQSASTQEQNNLEIIIKASEEDAFAPAPEGTLVASVGENLEGGLNGGTLEAQLLSQAGERIVFLTWCEQCGANTDGECLIHGSVITVSDNKLPSRARLSLPSILSLQPVSEDGVSGAEGVFAKSLIHPRTQFGPLEAPPLQAGATLPPGVFDVRVLKPEGQEQLDLSQEESCNWMMFVRPSHCDQDTNLVAYQQAHHIFYISTKAIVPKTELRVWYFHSYGQLLGKETLPPSLSPPPALPEAIEEAEDSHSQDDQGSMPVVGKGTRQSAEVSKLTCTSCNTTFRSLPLLWDHNCRILDDSRMVDTSSRPARRKGRPRKVAGAGKRGRPAAQATSGVTTATSTTILPSVTTLIKTEIKTEVPVPDSTVPDLQHAVVAKKRGRPKGSKNKPPAEGEVKPPRKPPLVAKRQRPKLDCRHCDKSFYSQEQHRVHEAEHTGVKPYVCSVEGCRKGFGSSFKYRRHSLVHMQPQDRKCPFCERRFNRVDHLKNHVATHNSNRQHWACDKCGKRYLYHGTFEYHMAIHDANESPQLVCRICSKNFTSRDSLLAHVHTHNRYKPDQNRSKSHKCPTCEKTFTTSKDVRRHMVTHTKDRSFLCDMCPQTFARKDHLRRHKRSNHKDEVAEEVGAGGALCARPLKAESYLSCALDADALKGQEGALVKLVAGADKQQMVMDAHTSKVVLMQVQHQQGAQPQQQQLSLLSQTSTPAPTIAPMQVAISQQNHQQHEQQQQQQQQQQILLQAGPYITTLAPGMEAQAIEVIADGNDQCNPSLPLKTIPYRFSSGQVLAAAPSAPTPSYPITPSLRQILSSCQPQQQQQQQQQQATVQQIQQQQQQQAQLVHQVSQPQPLYSQQDSSAPTPIMSMLASSRPDTFLELAAAGGKGQAVYATTDTGVQLKPLPQWVLTDTGQDAAAVQITSDSGDHCYATGITTGITTTNAEAGGLRVSTLAVPRKVLLGEDGVSLHLLQNCQVAAGMGGSVQSSASIQPGAGSSLQAPCDIQELPNFQDIVQAPMFNLPVTVNVPISDGPVSVTTSVPLSQPT
ncbi:uncharacterized protein LOC143280413 [Babylonia areolata]|uniref:uncharacterized protein LOC143280413 n=1 Tax=Babylonia areolata TaxID=304850 RepID=UPI003FD5C428